MKTKQFKKLKKQSNEVDYSKVAEIAPGVLHDIGNAVTGIQAQIDLLHMEGISSENFETFSSSLNEISTLLHHYNRQVNLMDNFNEKFTAKQEIESVVKIFMSHLRVLRIDMCLKLSEVDLVGDRSIFKRMILNLLINAIEAVSGIDYRPRRVCLKAKSHRGFYIIEVTDNGVGIPQNKVDKIFERGYSTKNYTNSGLGLRIVRDGVEKFGGNISVDSELGIGTVLKLTLPLSI